MILYAAGLGCKANAAAVDKTKFAAGQRYDNSALYQGKAGSASGAFSLFGAKKVAGKGWCSACPKKA
jgi:hypothetical protein